MFSNRCVFQLNGLKERMVEKRNQNCVSFVSFDPKHTSEDINCNYNLVYKYNVAKSFMNGAMRTGAHTHFTHIGTKLNKKKTNNSH